MLGEENSKMFYFFLSHCEEGVLSKIQAVQINDIPKTEDILQLNIFLYDLSSVKGELTGELARKNIQKYDKGVLFLRYNIHIWYVKNKIAFCKAF